MKEEVALFGVKVSAGEFLGSNAQNVRDNLNLSSSALAPVRPLIGPMRHPRAGDRGEPHDASHLGSFRNHPTQAIHGKQDNGSAPARNEPGTLQTVQLTRDCLAMAAHPGGQLGVGGRG